MTKKTTKQVALIARKKNTRVVLRTTTNPPRRKRNNQKMSRMVDMTKFALSQINPFSTQVDGVRIPDGFAYPAGTLVLRGNFELGNDATYTTGEAIAFNPYLSAYAYLPASITAGGTVTWAAGSSVALPQAAAVNSTFSSFRIVGGGLRITAEQSLTTATGHVWVAHVPGDLDADALGYSYWPTTENGFAALPLAEKYPTVELATNPLIVPFRRLDNSSYRYRDVQWPQNSSPYAETNTGWCNILLYTSGMAGGSSAKTLNVEFILHIEALHRGSAGTLLTPDLTVCPRDEKQLAIASHVAVMGPIAHVESKTEANDPEAWFDKLDSVVNRTINTTARFAQLGFSAYSAYQRITGATGGGGGRANNYLTYV